MYAIVDIETTGGNASDNKIIEIAILLFDGDKVIEEFETLVNPGIPVPRFISSLTGINSDMLLNAPSFAEIAFKVHHLLEGKVFVAHNVNFDYSFIRNELAALNLLIGAKRLCTVRLSRKLLPGKTSYSLGRLCKETGISIVNQHRAAGDARATAELFSLLIANDKEKFIETSVKKTSREILLPPNLNRKSFDKLPKAPGVYYFEDSKGKILYIGKAKNIKQRVASHFLIGSASRNKQNLINEIDKISFQDTGNELIALLKENQDIKYWWPKYNVAQRGPSVGYGIYEYSDRNNYQRWAIMKVKKYSNPVKKFSGLDEARHFIWKKVFEFNLCPRLAGLQKLNDACIPVSDYCCNGACEKKESTQVYNLKHMNASSSFAEAEETFAIIGKGRHHYEYSAVLVEQGNFIGFGFISRKVDINDYSLLKSSIMPANENELVKGILYSYLRKHPGTRIIKYDSNSLAKQKITLKISSKNEHLNVLSENSFFEIGTGLFASSNLHNVV